MEKDYKTLAIGAAILLAILIMCIDTAKASTVVTTDSEGYYNCEYYTGDVLIYRVSKGLCVDHQTVVSDNNHIMKDGLKMVDHKEFIGVAATSASTGDIINTNRAENKKKHAEKQERISMMRQFNLLKKLLKI